MLAVSELLPGVASTASGELTLAVLTKLPLSNGRCTRMITRRVTPTASGVNVQVTVAPLREQTPPSVETNVTVDVKPASSRKFGSVSVMIAVGTSSPLTCVIESRTK